MVQAGPGECQPDGVGPGVNHRFASPPLTVVVIPGLKGLVLKDVVAVAFAVMSVILTFVGVQPTLVFQAPTAGLADGAAEGAAAIPKAICPNGITRIINIKTDFTSSPNTLGLRWSLCLANRKAWFRLRCIRNLT